MSGVINALDAVGKYIIGEVTIEEAVQQLEKESKELSDDVRVFIVTELTDNYYEKHGNHVKETMLERLANVLLVDDLRSVNKPKREYPIMSDRKQKTIEEEHENNFASFDYFDEKGKERTPGSIANTGGRFTGGNTFYV